MSSFNDDHAVCREIFLADKETIASLREQLTSSEYRLGLADRNLEVVRGTVVEIKEQLRLAQEQLKEYRSWIIHTSEAEDVCTFYVLKEICINCRCSRAAPPTKVEGGK